MKAFITCIAVIAISASLLRGQVVLDRYVEEGLTSNLQLQQKALAVDKSLAALKEAKGMFYPQLSFQASYTLAGGGRVIAFPVGDLLNPVYNTLNQMLGEDAFPKVENVNEQFLPNDFHETKLRLIQPVFNQQLSINKRLQIASGELAAQQVEQYRSTLIREIKTAYFNYLQSLEAIKVYESTETVLQEVVRVNKRLVEKNKQTHDVLYQAEYQLIDNELQKANSLAANKTAQAYFNFLLNREAAASIIVDSTLVLGGEQASRENLLETAVKERPELELINRAKAINGLQKDLYQAEALPSLNAVVDLGYQGFGYTFNRDQDFWLGQVALNWNLFQGFQRKARMEQSAIEAQRLEKSELELKRQFELQIQQAWYELEAATQSLQSARAGLKAASAAFRITDRKYQEDQASWLQWNESRSALTRAQHSLSNARYTFLNKQVALQFAAGTLNQ
jgi:outer membrane protein TolC